MHRTEQSKPQSKILELFLFVANIMVLAKQEKCAQYWPETLNEAITPGDRISVTLLTSTQYPEYSIRKFEVKHVSDFHIHKNEHMNYFALHNL